MRTYLAPNTLHYRYISDWRDRVPEARTYGAPGLARRAKRLLVLDETLGDEAPEAWEGAFEQCVVPRSLLTEIDFLHRPTRTLIITDPIENFEPQRVRNPVLRWLIQRTGAADPDGKVPIDMQRIILSHGRCYEANGAAELKRTFRWIL